MRKPIAVFVGLRYLRSRQEGVFVSFVTLASVIGVTLGVAALIVVLSVMNGFETELRERLLSMTSHASILAGEEALDWQGIVADIESKPGISGAAPFVETEAMMAHAGELAGVLVIGVDPSLESGVSDVGEHLVSGALSDLQSGSWRMFIGRALAQRLGVLPGDSVTVLVPQLRAPGRGVGSRLRRFTIVGIFEIGLQDHDAVRALVHVDDATVLAGQPGRVTGVRIRADDIFAAPRLVRDWFETTGRGDVSIRDWTEENASYFRAIRIEKTMMTLLLSLIIGVAAFNIVATLVMVVTEKRSGIAILRTLGCSRRDVVGVFVLQGTIIGWMGAALGIVLGVAMALNVDTLAPRLERLIGFQFMPADLYYLTALPSELHGEDVLWTGVIVLVLTAIATVYPALRAAAVEPAEVLRYE